MKHTTFENELNEIRRRAIQELKKALEAHGGKYDYTQFDHVPVVCGDKVLNATISPANYIWLETEDNVWTLDNLHVEDIVKLTDYIADTDDVKDVSVVYPVPVTWVDRDDIEMQGFKTEVMTQKDLEKIAERMCDIYNNGDFCSDLDLACKDCGLKEKED